MSTLYCCLITICRSTILEGTGIIQMLLGGPKIDCGFDDDDDVRKSFKYSDVHFCCGMV